MVFQLISAISDSRIKAGIMSEWGYCPSGVYQGCTLLIVFFEGKPQPIKVHHDLVFTFVGL
jgi:hypothetical protein